MKKLYFLKPKNLLRRMTLFHILQIFQGFGLREGSGILTICCVFNLVGMLFWMKYMKKIWP